jgi:hypothetical protein
VVSHYSFETLLMAFLLLLAGNLFKGFLALADSKQSTPARAPSCLLPAILGRAAHDQVARREVQECALVYDRAHLAVSAAGVLGTGRSASACTSDGEAPKRRRKARLK